MRFIRIVINSGEWYNLYICLYVPIDQIPINSTYRETIRPDVNLREIRMVTNRVSDCP